MATSRQLRRADTVQLESILLVWQPTRRRDVTVIKVASEE